MRNKCHYFLLLFIPVFLLVAFLSPAHAGRLDLTPEEQQWLAEHPVLRVANEDDWPPYDFSKNGVAQGLSIDLMNELAGRLGVKVEYVNGYSWEELLEKGRNKELDVFPSIVQTPEREPFLLFTAPYMPTHEVIIVHSADDSVKDIADLRGRSIALVRGYAEVELIRNNFPEIRIIETATPLEALRLVATQQADAAYATHGYYSYEKKRALLSDLKIAGMTSLAGLTQMYQLSMAVRNDWPILQQLLQKALASLSQSELLAIQDKWLERITLQQSAEILTADERAWLRAHPKIVLGTGEDWAPYVIPNRDGSLSGIDVDYIALLKAKLGANIELRIGPWPEMVKLAEAGEIDGLADSAPLPSRRSHFLFTDTYHQVAKMVYTRGKSALSIGGLEDLQGRKVAIRKGIAFEKQLLAEYPGIEVVEAVDTDELVNRLLADDVDAIIGDSIVHHLLLSHRVPGLKIAHVIHQPTLDLVYSIRKDWPQLVSILNKGLAAIHGEEHAAILKRWAGLPGIDQPAAQPDAKGGLTAEERAWLATNPQPEIAFTADFEPAVIVADDGTHSGLLVELLQMVNQRLGTDIRLKIMARSEYSDAIKQKQVTGIMALSPATAEALELIATRSFLTIYPTIFGRKENLPEVRGLQDLKGHSLAVIKGTFYAKKLLQQGTEGITIQEVDSSLDGMKKVFTGEVDALLGLNLQNYMINRHLLHGVEPVAILPDAGFQVASGIRSDLPVFASILDKGLARVSAGEYAVLLNRWVRIAGQQEFIELSAEEQFWLQQHPVVKVGLPSLPPLIFQDAKGEIAGVVADYLALFTQKTGLQFQPVSLPWPEMMARAKERKIHLFAGIETPERKAFADFTTPFLPISYVIINRQETPFIGDLSNLNGQKVAVIENVSIHRRLESDFPELQLVAFANMPEALQAVAKGQVEAYVGPLLTASYQIQKLALNNLKVAAPTPYDDESLSFAVRKDWPQLSAVLNKVIESISREQQDAILQKWLQVRYEQGVDWSLVWKWAGGVGGLMGLVIIGTITWNRRLKQEVASRTAELRESEERFRNVIEQASDGIFLLDNQARFIDVNQQACKDLGYSREELRNMTAGDIETAYSVDDIIEKLEQVAERQQPVVLEAVQRCKDGSQLAAEVSIAPLQLGENQLFIAISRNVSIRRKVEETLYFVSQQGWTEQEAEFLPALARYIGTTLQLEYALIGKLLPGQRVRTMGLFAHGELVENIEYDLQGTPCVDVVGQQLCSHASGIQNKFPEDHLLVEMQAESYVGTPLWNAQGEPIGLVAVLGVKPLHNRELVESVLPVVAVRAAHELERLEDQAELARYQEHLEDLIEERTDQLVSAKRNLDLALQSAKAGTFYLDFASDELSWDQRSIDMFGAESISKYADWVQFVHPEDLPALQRQIERDIAAAEITDLHYRIIRPDGEIRHIWAVAMIIRDEETQRVALSGLHFDETEKVLADAELKRSKEQAEAANRAKSVFLANMSHELRTPLTAILGYSHLLQKNKELPEKVQDKVAIINRSGEYLTKLINDVLEVSRIETGYAEVERESFSLPVFLGELKEMFSLRAEEKGLQLMFENRDSLPENVIGDIGKMRQVLVNLIGNAVKFTGSGGIVVRTEMPQQNNGQLLFAVKDSGPGIAADELARLFKPFEQTVTGKSEGGTGLGLVIARQYARLLGGDLMVSSEVGNGSTFTFSCQVGAVEDVPGERAENRQVIGLKPAGRELKVLIADDILETRELMVQLLTGSGISIVEAEDGLDALAKIEVEAPDLVIMDMRMPKLDGYQAISRIKELKLSNAPIIAVSASAFESDRNAILTAGADAFIRKPIEYDQFYLAVSQQLGVACIYADVGDAQQVAELSATDLAELPVGLIRKLASAAQKLDVAEISAAIEKIRAVNPSIGERLQLFAKEYRYDKLQDLVAEPDSGKDEDE